MIVFVDVFKPNRTNDYKLGQSFRVYKNMKFEKFTQKIIRPLHK